MMNSPDLILDSQFTLLEALKAEDIRHRFRPHLENDLIQIPVFEGQLFQSFDELGLSLVRIVLVPAAHVI